MLLGPKGLLSVFTNIKNVFDSGSPSDRASNFEVLRIIAMFMIVFHHYGGEETFSFDRESETYRWFNEYWVKSMATTGKVGVSIFLLMTGYFQNGKAVKVTSIARTWFQAVSWTYIIAGVWYLRGLNVFEYGWKPIILPVFNHNYWFVSTYITVACFSGWTAAICKNATPAQYVTGLLTMFMMMSWFQWDGFIAFCNTQWFMFVMALGGFLRRFSKSFEFISKRMLIIVLCMLTIAIYSSTYLFMFYDIEWSKRHGGVNALVRENWCPTSLLVGVILVMITERTERFVSPIINRISALSLGVYLVHEHILVRHILWKDVIMGVRFRDYVSMPVICVLQVCMVYLICSFLELLRKTILGSIETFTADRVGKIGRRIGDLVNAHFDEVEFEKV